MKIFVIASVIVTSLLNQGVPGTTVRTGEFSTRATITDLLDEAQAQPFADIISGDESIEWEIYVPEGYNPEVPAGLLVYVSPGNSGEIPDEWKELMGQRNLIWIGANRSGNNTATALRMTYALLAPTVIDKSYELNYDRIYISGFSGGGRIASLLIPEYPHLFRGAIYNCGVNFWGKETPQRYEEIKKNHYVFITGTKDFNLRDTKNVYRAYKRAGVKNAKLMVIPNMSHANPRMSKYAEAIDFLDSRVVD